MFNRSTTPLLPVTTLYAQQNRTKMNTISITYDYVWRVDYAPNYVFTKCGKCFNLKRNKELKKKLKRYTQGYNIESKFISLEKLRPFLVKIEKDNCPF